MRTEDAGYLTDAYLRRIELDARVHAGPALPADLAWVEWPAHGGALHALARPFRGGWRTTLVRTRPGQDWRDVVARMRAPKGEPRAAGGPEIVDLPDAACARIVTGALCGDLAGLLAVALEGSGHHPDARLVEAAESLHAIHVAPVVDLLHGTDLVDAFGDCAAGRVLPDALGPLTEPGPRGEALRALRRTHPLVARVALSSTLVVGALRAGEGLHAALAVPCPGYAPAHLRRAAGARLEPIALTAPLGDGTAPDEGEVLRRARLALRLAASLPPDWMPATPAAWGALATVADALSATSALDGRCLGRCKGDWVGLLDRLARLLGVEGRHPRQVSEALSGATAGLREVQQAFLRQVTLPLRANAEHRLGFPGAQGDGSLDDAAGPAERAAAHLLWGDKDLGACVAQVLRWRSRREAIAVAAVPADPGLTWPPLGGRFRHGPAEVRPILDALALWEEGISGADRDGHPGLDHCVYGRLRAFRQGFAHVVSVRDAATGARLSTAQFEVTAGGVRLVEHRGRANVAPPDEAVAAVEAFAAAVDGGRLGPPPAVPQPDWCLDALCELCGYDWRDPDALDAALLAWAPLLPRWFRGLPGPAAFDALAARGLLPPVA